MFLKKDFKQNKIQMENLDYKIFNSLDTELENIWKSFEKDSHNFVFQKYDFIKDYTIDRKSHYLLSIQTFKSLVLYPFLIGDN